MCVVILMHSDGDFLIKQLHWDADRYEEKENTGQMMLIPGLKVFRIKSAQLLTMESAISSDFSVCSASHLHIQMSFLSTLEEVSARADRAVRLCL